MPLCPQITNTPITVSLTADFTVTNVVPVLPANTQQLDEVIVLADGKTKAFYQATAPTVGVSEGDIWFDTDDGNKQYYYNGTAWVSVQDTAIAAATSAAAAATAASAAAAAAAVAAQTTADGKNKVFRQTSAPTASAAGDHWFDTDDDNRIYRWSGSSWVANDLGTNALANFSANKITSGTIDASVITVSNINAGNISTGTLAADRILAASITGAKIAANTITAANITAGTITATEIAAGTITAAKIAAGTITATEIAAGTITTDKLVAGTLTGFVVQTSAGSNAVILNGGSNAIQFKNGGSVLANMVPLGSGGLLMHYGTTPDPSGGAFPQIFLGSANISLNVNKTGGGGINTIAVNGDYISLSATYTYARERFYVEDTSISTAAPNGRIDSDGRVRRTTGSSIRFKDNVVDLVTISEIGPSKLLELPVRAFKFKADYLDSLDNRVNVIVPGFIAEEMDNFYPAAADYDTEGNPENWNERFIIPGMLALIQDLYKEVQTLKGE